MVSAFGQTAWMLASCQCEHPLACEPNGNPKESVEVVSRSQVHQLPPWQILADLSRSWQILAATPRPSPRPMRPSYAKLLKLEWRVPLPRGNFPIRRCPELSSVVPLNAAPPRPGARARGAGSHRGGLPTAAAAVGAPAPDMGFGMVPILLTVIHIHIIHYYSISVLVDSR